MTRSVRRRRVLIAALLIPGILVVAGVAGVGWYFSTQLLGPDHSPPSYDIIVRAASATTVEMDKTTDTARQGTFGLEWSGGHAVVGKVINTTSGTVTRALQDASSSLQVGDRVVLTTPVYQGDPEAAFGIPSDDVLIPGELGMLPAWYVPGRLRDFVIVVHGHNAPQTDGLRIVRALTKLGLPMVLIRYRNDVGAPASPDHLLHLGDTEWRDVEAAVRWALANGATRVVLVGISMGGGVVQLFMRNSSFAAKVPAVILDSPVLDWDAVINFQAARRGVPNFLVWPTEQVVRLRIGFDVMSYNQVRDAGSMRAPTLLFQDGKETFLPPEGAARLAKARPDLVEYHFFPDAGHTQEWNVDQVAYESMLTSFLVRKLGLVAA